MSEVTHIYCRVEYDGGRITSERTASGWSIGYHGENPDTRYLSSDLTWRDRSDCDGYGSNEGGRVELLYDRGRVFSMPEKDQHQTGFGGRMLRAV